MAEAMEVKKLWGLSSTAKINTFTAIAAALFVGLFVLIGIKQLEPPDIVPASAAADQFSADRALKHLRVIAQRPHPIGSSEHSVVRDYIVRELTEMGLAPEIQNTTVVNSTSTPPFTAARIENIIAKLPGTASGKAVVLVGHYDTVPTSPGASDNGAGVVTILETISALKSSSPLRNDVIFLFTDGEELGLLGAKAFIEEHRFARQIGVVMNFEARGSGGPVVMFETGSENGKIIKEFGRVAPYPVASSLSNQIYKLLPNDTDMTIFKRAGLPGLNFAYMDGLNHYHTQIDNLNAIDGRSLQHHGSYAIALTRHLGNIDIESLKDQDAVYFNTAGVGFVNYSESWGMALMIVTLSLFCLIVFFGIKRDKLTTRGLWYGFAALLVAGIAVTIAVTVIWRLIRASEGISNLAPAEARYDEKFIFLGLLAISLSLTSGLYLWFRKKARALDLTVGGMVWWIIATILTTLLLPGGSYLFALSLPLILISLGVIIFRRDQEISSAGNLALYTLSIMPAFILFSSILYLTLIALGLGLAGPLMAIVVLLSGLLIPILTVIADLKKWFLPVFSAIVALCFIGAGILADGYDGNNPKPSHVFYALNADLGKAVWASSEPLSDNWTAQFFSAGYEESALEEYVPVSFRDFMVTDAAVANLSAPSIDLIEDKKDGETRRLRLRIFSFRKAPVVSVCLDPEIEVVSAAINGKRINQAPAREDSWPWSITCYAMPAEGFELELQIKSTAQVKGKIVDRSYGLNGLTGLSFEEKPAQVMAAAYPYSDSVLVSKSFVY